LEEKLQSLELLVTVTNTGNVTLHDITIDDPLIPVTGGVLSELAPGESDETSFTAVYVVTAEDLKTGFVTNQATVTGYDTNNLPVTDISDDPVTTEMDDPTIVPTIGIIIPEIFTPNGDGVNDTLYITGLDKFKNPKIKIYNRWGNLVYEADPYTNDCRVFQRNDI